MISTGLDQTATANTCIDEPGDSEIKELEIVELFKIQCYFMAL